MMRFALLCAVALASCSAHAQVVDELAPKTVGKTTDVSFTTYQDVLDNDPSLVLGGGLAGVHAGLWGKSGCSVRSVNYDPDETAMFQTQEGLTTTITLPQWERIADYVISAPVFEVVKEGRGTNSITVRGVETDAGASVILWGKSGRLYSLYGRVDPLSSEDCPALVMKIRAAGPAVVPVSGSPIEGASVATSPASAPKKDEGKSSVPDFAEPAVARSLTFAYSMAGAKELAPDVVFSDGVFTFLYFEPERWNVTSMPAVFRVVDQKDVPAQIETEGNVIIVKALGALTLRVGDKFVCVRPAGWTPGGPGRAVVGPAP